VFDFRFFSSFEEVVFLARLAPFTVFDN
jgi:hypothetical protein